LAGAVNLAAEARNNGDVIHTTYRIVRGAKEKSYGHVQAELMGITAEALKQQLLKEVAEGWYPPEDTRLLADAVPENARGAK
jgi:DNA mismatch repair ATPase MutS